MTNSLLTRYNNYKKLTRYITEYMYWLYSRYLHNKGYEMNLLTIAKFGKTKIKVIKDFKYMPIEQTFKENSSIMRNKRLVVDSTETKKRLLYVLRNYMKRHRKDLLTYRNRQKINKFYIDLTDFDQYPTQVLLQGKQSVTKWINNQRNIYELYDSVQVDFIKPYFFTNTHIDEDIWLAYNTTTSKEALAIARTWSIEGYNPTLEERVPKDEAALPLRQGSTRGSPAAQRPIVRYMLYAYEKSK